ncbi:hypothetical protein BK269_23725 [Escherichia coli]|nr:hypothetical protein BK269_23725 [Escherichia coli]
MKEELAAALMDSHQQKQWHKAQKKKHKQEAKAAKAKAKLGEVATDSKPRVWVLDFKGRSQFGIRIDHDLASISDHSLASQSITIWHASDH